MSELSDRNAPARPHVAALVFSPFQENTYVVYGTSGRAVVIDPGCYGADEERELQRFLADADLTPTRLLNTHGHLDHIFGNAFVAATYGLPVETHRGELPVYAAAPAVATQYGIPFPKPSPTPTVFHEAGEPIDCGDFTFEVILAPGHSPASIAFYCRAGGFVIGGDVLFRDSIGRTDLPGGDHATLLRSIREQFLVLPDETVVYPGHGPETTIGYERTNNPFLRS